MINIVKETDNANYVTLTVETHSIIYVVVMIAFLHQPKFLWKMEKIVKMAKLQIGDAVKSGKITNIKRLSMYENN